ncbi:MAG: aminodeoxychorismate lyase [Hahellaceae bacterium]|nr:aminodeoxychorismate lyase [Hahellaceae bacterium]
MKSLQSYLVTSDGFVPASWVADRGLMYGDGLFETIRVIDGSMPLKDWHVDRLLRGCEKLVIPITRDRIDELFCHIFLSFQNEFVSASVVLKLVVTRGIGGRGYSEPDSVSPAVYVLLSPMPEYETDNYNRGIESTICEYRLSENRFLAGLKHLNRLDQVMASRELGSCPEAFVLDQSGLVVEGTRSNLLLERNGVIYTPLIVGAGVRGVLVSWLKSNAPKIGLEIREASIDPDDLLTADGLAFANSVFGLWPVRALRGRQIPVSQGIRRLQVYLHESLGYPGVTF